MISAVVVLLAWIGPDLLGTGGLTSASRAARGEPSLGSAALESIPGLAVLADAVDLLTIPAAIMAVVAVIAGPRVVRVLGAAAALWVVIVAVMAQAGYAGNPRYLVAAAAVGCVLAGVGAARMPVLAVVVVVATGLITIGDLRDQAHDLQARADRREALGDLVTAAGGRAALTRCRVRTAPDVRPLVAFQLDISMLGIDRPPQRPDVVAALAPARRRTGRSQARSHRLPAARARPRLGGLGRLRALASRADGRDRDRGPRRGGRSDRRP